MTSPCANPDPNHQPAPKKKREKAFTIEKDPYGENYEFFKQGISPVKVSYKAQAILGVVIVVVVVAVVLLIA